VFEPLFAQLGGNLDEFNKLKFDRDGVVSSGPYRLLNYSSEKIALVRDDKYWGNGALHGGKLSAVKYVVHPIYKSNDHFSVALQQGRLDGSSSFVPRIWLKQKKGVRSWLDQEPLPGADRVSQLAELSTRIAKMWANYRLLYPNGPPAIRRMYVLFDRRVTVKAAVEVIATIGRDDILIPLAAPEHWTPALPASPALNTRLRSFKEHVDAVRDLADVLERRSGATSRSRAGRAIVRRP